MSSDPHYPSHTRNLKGNPGISSGLQNPNTRNTVSGQHLQERLRGAGRSIPVAANQPGARLLADRAPTGVSTRIGHAGQGARGTPTFSGSPGVMGRGTSPRLSTGFEAPGDPNPFMSAFGVAIALVCAFALATGWLGVGWSLLTGAVQ